MKSYNWDMTGDINYTNYFANIQVQGCALKKKVRESGALILRNLGCSAKYFYSLVSHEQK